MAMYLVGQPMYANPGQEFNTLSNRRRFATKYSVKNHSCYLPLNTRHMIFIYTHSSRYRIFPPHFLFLNGSNLFEEWTSEGRIRFLVGHLCHRLYQHSTVRSCLKEADYAAYSQKYINLVWWTQLARFQFSVRSVSWLSFPEFLLTF